MKDSNGVDLQIDDIVWHKYFECYGKITDFHPHLRGISVILLEDQSLFAHTHQPRWSITNVTLGTDENIMLWMLENR